MVDDPILGGWREHRFGMPEERWAWLAGRSAWVTGAGTGFGQAIAVGLMLAGCRVYLSGRRDSKLGETAHLAKEAGAALGLAVPLPVDLTDEASLRAAVSEIAAASPATTLLVNNAAVPINEGTTPLLDMDPTDWSRHMAINVTAPWLATKLLFPTLAAAGEARVLFVSSLAGWHFTPGFGPYNMAKAALNSLALSFADEAAAAHPAMDVQINALVPGEARTEMNQGSEVSPFTVLPMALRLLSQPSGGPNGYAFERSGTALPVASRPAYAQPLA
ncbi:MAG: SDR family oxidoreductase [Alphaproteobacteria bacterium]|nr:SDR family oxidoreductase [Alphaproteobacteria bacterium]